MKNVMILVIMALVLSACGKDGSNGVNGSSGVNAPLNSSILNVWTSTDPASRIPTLDLSNLTLDSVSDISSVYDCVGLLNGQADESGTTPVNGVAKNQVGLSGSTNSGLIQFGPLSHADHNSDNACYTLGQEEYSYNIDGNTLTLCDAKYSVCSTFTTNN